MLSPEFIAVPRAAIEWLKQRYPVACEKSGLAERIGGTLYTKTRLDDWPVADRFVDCGETRPLPMYHLHTLLRHREEYANVRECAGDSPENTTDNPESVAVWRKRALVAELTNAGLVTACRQAIVAIKGREHTGFLETAIAKAADCANAADYAAAYEGAREDLAIWKRRALEAERDLREAKAPLALREELLRIARLIEDLKQECGMDPESPRAIQNGRYMSIAAMLRDLADIPA